MGDRAGARRACELRVDVREDERVDAGWGVGFLDEERPELLVDERDDVELEGLVVVPPLPAGAFFLVVFGKRFTFRENQNKSPNDPILARLLSEGNARCTKCQRGQG